MSKIDKIIQIVSEPDGVLYGLSETGRLYSFHSDYYIEGETRTHRPAQW